MALLPRASLALVLSSAFVLAVACSSTNKKTALPAGEGGEAGSSEAAGAPAVAGGGSAGEGGSGEPAPAAGAAGEVSEGGAGGSTSVESAAGAAGEGTVGAAGSGDVACMPSGSVGGLGFDTEPTYSVCRGGLALLPFLATDADPQFSCCGTSNAAYDFPLLGLSDSQGDGKGQLEFLVPADAPLTEQAVSAACSDGPSSSTAKISVTDSAPPTVGSVSEQIVTTNDTLQINGSHLGTVDRIRAIPLDDQASYAVRCNIDPETQSDDSVTCSFAFIPEGRYVISVFDAFCGAVSTPMFHVSKPID